MAPRGDSRVTLPDGRALAFTEWGTADGRPVMYFHGRPGSRLWCPDEGATLEADVRLIIPDRPGVGGSDPLPGRTLRDWPTDVARLADHLGIPTFGVVGASAGGPYALACAALLADRVSRVVDASSGVAAFAWEERPGIRASWLPRMRDRHEVALADPAAAARMAAEAAATVLEAEWSPAVARAELEQADGDSWFYESAERTAAMDAQMGEWWRQGYDAVAWDLMDLVLPWGFRLADIKIPVTIFHGLQDPLVQLEDAEWEAAAMPNASLVTWPHSGHLGFVTHWTQVLAATAASPA